MPSSAYPMKSWKGFPAGKPRIAAARSGQAKDQMLTASRGMPQYPTRM